MPSEPGDDGLGVFRVAGKDRYLTGVEVSRLFEDGADVLYVATGEDFADALAAAAVAGYESAPVLLTQGDRLDARVAAAVREVAPVRIVIVGGTGAVSSGVEKSLQSLGVADVVDRVSGSDRFGTAAALALDAFEDSGVEVVYVASGSGYPDALAASAAASFEGGPVLLTAKDGLPKATRDVLERLAPKRVVVVGGLGVVSAAAGDAAVGVAGSEGVRYSGANRYATAQVVAQRVFGGHDVALAVVASGKAFPDALTGAAFAGAKRGPVLLSDPGVLNAETAIALRDLKPGSVMIAGGKGAVSDRVMHAISGVTGLEIR